MTSSDPSPDSTSSLPRVAPLDWPRSHGRVDEVLKDITTKLANRRRRRLRQGGSTLVLGLLIFAGAWGLPWLRHTDRVGTAAATRQSLALADGSTAELNARTQLKTDFRYGRRRLRLEQGEAFFSVIKDVAHPFLVETPAGLVRVTGTQFNVRLTPQGVTEVTLIEGSVEFIPATRPPSEPSATPVTLAPGRQLRAQTAGVELRTLSSTALDDAVAWRRGRLVLDDLTLAEVASRFTAYHGKTITVAPDIATLKMGGSCPLDDLPGFLDFLTQALAVRVVREANETYRVTAR
ncbi:MAG: FecR domain-containing protein [Opitutaceae bacterium]|nr:FecR domain-containing protein [Opitutaceae bacterium]